jgi:5-methylcytosine-specific restriction endonuclease McrA
MAAKLCTADGCDRASKAKTLCGMHYNKQNPNHHLKILIPCDWCGTMALKEKRARRYTHTFCSEPCRQLKLFGNTCELPKDHWVYMLGATCEWTPPKPVPRFTSGYCQDCDEPFTIACKQPGRYCSNACIRRSSRRRRRAREAGAPGDFTYAQIMRQYLKQGQVCAYCNTKPVGLPDPEHVLALSRGGRNDMTNLVAACRPCNTDKGDLTLEEWAASRQRRGLSKVSTNLDGLAYMSIVKREPDRASWNERNAA